MFGLITAKAAAPSSLLRTPRTGVSSGRSSRSHRRSTLVVTAAKKKKKKGGGGGGGSGDNDYGYDDAGLFHDDDYGSSAGRAATRYPQNVDPFRSGGPGGKKGPSKKARRQKGSEDDVVADVSTVLSPGYKPRRSKVPAIGDSIDDGDFIGASIDEGFGGGGGGVLTKPRPTAAVKASVSAALISFDEDEAWSIAEADLAEVNAAPKQAPKPKNKMKKKKAAPPASAKPAAPPDPVKDRNNARKKLVKWGFLEADVDMALDAVATDSAEGGAKKLRVAALDWMLLRAPEENIPVDYKSDAAQIRAAA